VERGSRKLQGRMTAS